MKTLKLKKVDSYELAGLTCDKCHREYTTSMEMQEFLFIDFVGGFASEFGDGVHIRAEICQHCLKRFLADLNFGNDVII